MTNDRIVSHLADIRENSRHSTRSLNTLNANVQSVEKRLIELNQRDRNKYDLLVEIRDALTGEIDVDKLLADAEKLKALRELTRELEADPIHLMPRFIVGTPIVVIDDEHHYYGWRGVVSGMFPNNMRIDFSGDDSKYSMMEGRQLHALRWPVPEIITDANDVELPAEVVKAGNPHFPDADGRLFPWQWRENLGFYKITEDLREYHRTHENHPMTEEAFRVYNAGLTAEIAVKEKQENQP